ncbi:dienelactone hydrolase family protein [Rhodohalobacter mucosus]|uniref:Carboxymethylenebutenolidase n=1 Tax=Rhodohalobacter mucosus TaxID=2079485 RepID=A0A316TW39_9BACT|nr:dienelactone hydrolase family protein [Rhodohalobacter mucosus]PWN06744.1 carboxymethylenebutenolidase [Rhodohalobacter mucosus]
MKTLIISLYLIFTAQSLSAQDFALNQLENSPRHHEWVTLQSGDRDLYNFIAYPEVSGPAPVIIVIHENRGLTDWVRSFADQAAAAGYIAIAPDLLSGFSEEYPRTSDYPSSDAARDALYKLAPDQITEDLHAVYDYVSGLEAAGETVVVAGFCWGGSQTFRFATNSSQIDAAMVFYGSAPTEESAIQRIEAPVYGFYGENDARINSGIPAVEELMQRNGKTYEYEIYEGAGHAYMRSGDDPEGPEANKAARNASWERLKQIMSSL